MENWNIISRNKKFGVFQKQKRKAIENKKKLIWVCCERESTSNRYFNISRKRKEHLQQIQCKCWRMEFIFLLRLLVVELELQSLFMGILQKAQFL